MILQQTPAATTTTTNISSNITQRLKRHAELTKKMWWIYHLPYIAENIKSQTQNTFTQFGWLSHVISSSFVFSFVFLGFSHVKWHTQEKKVTWKNWVLFFVYVDFGKYVVPYEVRRLPFSFLLAMMVRRHL